MNTAAETTSRARSSPVLALACASIVGVLIGLALIGSTPVPGVTNASAVVSAAIPLVRAVLNLAAILTTGLGLLSILAGTDRPALAEPVLAKARRGAVAGALVWATSAVVALVLQTAEFRPGTTKLAPRDVWAYVSTVGAGKALLSIAALALVLAGLWVLTVFLGERVPAEVRVGLALFTLLPLPVTGHAGNWEFRDYTMISLELHVLAVVTWTGGLAALTVLVAGQRALLATALPRFSKLATLCLAVAVATGLFNALVELNLNPNLGLVEAIFGTPYGRLAMLKLACGIAIGVLGANLRWRLLPGVVRHRRTALAGWATLELSIMGLAVGFAVVLSRAPVVP